MKMISQTGITLHDHWTEAGCKGADNEDAWTFVQRGSLQAVIVLDGCTDVDRETLYPGIEGGTYVSNAAWHKERLKHHLELNFNSAILSAPKRFLGDVVNEIRKDYLDLGLKLDRDAWAYPSSTFMATIVDPEQDLLQVLWIGDSYCSIQKKNGKIIVYPSVETGKREVILNRKHTAKKGSALLKDNLQYYRDERVETIEGGLNSLSLFPDRIHGLNSINFKASDCEHVLLASDGFYRLVTHYALHSPKSLMQEVIQNGVQACGEKLRRYEQDNIEKIAKDSAKIGDDATAVLTRITHSSAMPTPI